MLMKDNKKSIATLIAKRAKGPSHIDNMQPEFKESPEKEGALQDNSVGLESAAEELLSAIESKSPKAVVEAFKALAEMCEYDEPMEASESKE